MQQTHCQLCCHKLSVDRQLWMVSSLNVSLEKEIKDRGVRTEIERRGWGKNEFSAHQLCWFGLARLWSCLGLAMEQMPLLGQGGGSCSQPGNLQPSLWLCRDRSGFGPKAGIATLFTHRLWVSCQNGLLRFLRWQCYVSNGMSKFWWTWRGFAACTSCLFRSSKGKPKENLAISPVLSVISHSHASEGIKSGSLFPVKPREMGYCSELRFIF